ncbi:MAG: class I SAM-dependent methyltransferase [Gammaproteobacteria bacterium]|nr:class I SAM-dependent methyltransferase [Gammaproteobacteria bacterium]
MLSYRDIVKLKTLFQNNENIIHYIKSNTDLNPEEAILHSYDLQAGSYIKALSDQKAHKILKEQIGLKLAGILKDLSVNHVCEAGVGEATTLSHVLSEVQFNKTFAFDISMSRLLYANEYLANNNHNVNLFCSELSSIPFPDNSIECIYTYHTLESNGGNEEYLLKELLRVTNKYLILIEPDYDLFGNEQKLRMTSHGYIKHLQQHLSKLNANIIRHEPWELDSNPLNKASIIIVEKDNVNQIPDEVNFCSPISYQDLIKVDEGFFCKSDGFLFPTVKNIPVFLKKNAILISHYDSFKQDIL